MLTPLEILKENAEKPTGWRIDPRSPAGKSYLKYREWPVCDLKAKLQGLYDPNVFYTKHTLIKAVCSL
ncbi:hypothetical protein DVP47_14850 [Yersinia enterocolitica]|uniref:Uncharacterized protein n=1 Tax=Yersinia enterocolitica TaxID=630 RepID=A0A0T7P8N0_YEREN|nr:hypothetical protein [Yersinia enterocolitica]EKN6292967.1 hypothetical protein [Yersinia enterocolitica]EKN6300682.1 hypothetical protein [Yersinia enterocolitica]EKN6305191.1 hypothetical protein [Yersinia enterocolitica]EKN6309105.1 hypothetical protein [Yersinia enterocolitica]